VRRIGTDGIISTVVGNGSYGTDIVEGALATEGPIDRADGLAFDRDGILYVSGMGRIRKVLPDGRIFTVVGGNVLARDLEDGLCATRVSGYAPMAIDASNNLYFSSFSGSTSQVARIAPSAGRVSVVAGVGRDIHGASGDGVPARSAVFGSLVGLAVDSAGNLYISSGNRVRRVSAASPRSSP
jgi:sugar lactone lactonase YvrE